MFRSPIVFVVLLAQFATLCQAKVYPSRWVFVSNSLRSEQDVNEVERIARTASEHGLNGMVLTAGLDYLDLQPPEYLGRLAKVKATCDKLGVEIIPCIFSVGYGGALLAYNRNLAAGIPVIDAPFVVKNGVAHLDPDRAVRIANGGFEEYDGDRLKGYGFHDKPGDVSFVDSTVFHGGQASLRFEGFGRYEHGQVAILRQVNPKAEVFIWSDMLDPNHNAHRDYYLVDGDFTGSWQYVPKDLTIACWYYEKRKESLEFFSSHGFKTLAGAYYGGDTLENPRGWLDALDRTPEAVGIMYTTWQAKYELLGPFGELLDQ